MSNWQRVAKCVECKETLSRDEELYSGGVCPYCGHNAYSTICDTDTVVARFVVDFTPTWWEWLVEGQRTRGHWEYKEGQRK